MTTQAMTNSSLLDEFDEIVTKPTSLKAFKAEDVTEEATLALLQQNRVLQAEHANLTVREALTARGASIPECAQVLGDIIQNPALKADVRRRAVSDALTLHNAKPATKAEEAPQALQIIIQTSDHVNFANVLNPARMKLPQYLEE